MLSDAGIFFTSCITFGVRRRLETMATPDVRKFDSAEDTVDALQRSSIGIRWLSR